MLAYGGLNMSCHQGCECSEIKGACNVQFQYAVKVVCGVVDVPHQGGAQPPVAPGTYRTAVNVFNRNVCHEASLRLKLAIAGQDRPGPVSEYIGPFRLKPDTAFEVDCPVMLAVAQNLTPNQPVKFIKGWLVIRSSVPLDVVGVYTGAQNPTGPLTTFHTERVEACCIPLCETFVQVFNTPGDWQTVSPTQGPVVAVSSPPSIWASPPLGSLWSSQRADHGTNAGPSGSYVYEVKFDLCSGFGRTSSFPLQVLVDDAAEVFLNGVQVGGTIPFNTLTPLNLLSTAQLVGGENTLQLRVQNTQAIATGFAVAGFLRVAQGKCPCATAPAARANVPVLASLREHIGGAPSGTD